MMRTNDRHRQIYRGVATGLSGLVLLAGCAALSEASEEFLFHRFVQISASELGDSVSRKPSLNNAGLVTFSTRSRVGERQIWTSSDAATTLESIASTQQAAFVCLGKDPSINDEGDVAFADCSAGIVRKPSEGLKISIARDGDIVEGSGTITLLRDMAVAINDAGTVLFFSRLTNAGDVKVGNFVGAGGPIRAIATKPLANSGEEALGVFNLNAEGKIAWRDTAIDAEPGREAIFLTDPGALATTGSLLVSLIAETSGYGNFDKLFQGLSVNDSNTVAFSARRDSGVRGVFTGRRDETIETVADTSGAFSEFQFVSINAEGQVAFQATLDIGAGQGIFIGPDPVLDRVVGKGDVIGNRTVKEVALGPESLNDRGQIAFFADFETGGEDIFRADPLRPFLPADPSRVMQLSTGGGTGAGASQTVATPSPLGIARLNIEWRFLSTSGQVVFNVGGNEVGRIAAPSTLEGEFSASTIPVDLAKLGADAAAADRLSVQFELRGPPGATVQIKAIDFPGLINGDFAQGFLDVWEVYTPRGASAMIVMARPGAAPY